MEFGFPLLVLFSLLVGCGGLLVGGIILCVRGLGRWRWLAAPFLLASVAGWGGAGFMLVTDKGESGWESGVAPAPHR